MAPSDLSDVIAAVRREQARRRELDRLKDDCERDLMTFIRGFWHVLEPVTPLAEGWVLYAMVDLLMAAADGHHNRIIVNVSPGSMKSLLLNVFFPAWLWGPNKQPHLRFLSASYSTALPERDNAKFQRLIESTEYQRLWGDQVKLVRSGVGLIENSRTGWKRATSTGGGTTGHRGDYVLIDDANNPIDVESDTVREATNRWLTEIMPDRLNDLDTGVIINLQQRTHMEDATGTLAKTWGDRATWLCIPMRFDPLRATPVVVRTEEDGTPIQVWRDPRGLDEDGIELEGIFIDEQGRARVRAGSPMALAEGELCWPERFSAEAVANLEMEKTAWAWAGQYQQSPTVRGGGIIRDEWWQTWDKPEFPTLGTVVGSLDTAIKEGETNDFNAFTTWGAFADAKTGAPRLMLTSAWQMRCSLAELVRRTAESCFECKVDYLIIEDKARGHDVAAEIRRQYADAPWQTILIPANGRGSFSGDKRARLEAVSVMFSGDVRRIPAPGGKGGETMEMWSGGMIFAPNTTWADEVIRQVDDFPTAPHDDLTDSVSMALSFVRRHGVVVREAEHVAAETEKRMYRRAPGVPYAI